jgi:hypothetical protein
MNLPGIPILLPGRDGPHRSRGDGEVAYSACSARLAIQPVQLGIACHFRTHVSVVFFSVHCSPGRYF